MRTSLTIALLLATSMLLTAQDKPRRPSSVDGAGISLPGGLAYWDLKMGTGVAATKGSKITVNYTGWLLEQGTKFDSSFDRNEPLVITLGAGQVIKGWDVGLIGMKVGGKRQLRIPPEMAYGWRGQPPVIPPSAYLLFDVELLGVN